MQYIRTKLRSLIFCVERFKRFLISWYHYLGRNIQRDLKRCVCGCKPNIYQGGELWDGLCDDLIVDDSEMDDKGWFSIRCQSCKRGTVGRVSVDCASQDWNTHNLLETGSF